LARDGESPVHPRLGRDLADVRRGYEATGAARVEPFIDDMALV
jgi:hypothetical protein